MVQNRFSGNGLYLLDEPESALSPQRQLALLRLIHELVLAGSQFIIATHAPILMAYPDALLYLLTEDGLATSAFKETEHFLLMQQFLQDPDHLLAHLLADK